MAGFIGSPPMNFFEGRIERRGGRLFFVEPHFALAVDDAQREALDRYDGKAVVFGVRPEDLNDILFVGNPHPDHQLKARVEVVEPMGAEVYLYLNSGSHPFVVRLNTQDTARVNQEVTMVVEMKKTHFFHADTGVSIV